MVAAAPAVAQQPDRRVEVLGNRLGGDAADLEQGVAVDQRRRAAPVDAAVAVLAGADDAVEERLLVAADGVVLGGVVVEEVVRRLDHRHPLVVEVADQGVERVGHRHVVGVEHQHQVALGPRQRRVEVARLGVRVVAADQVAGARQPCQLLHLRAAAVVEQVGRVRVGQRPAAGQGRHHYLDRLVVGADVDVDRAPRRRRRPPRRRPRPGEPGEDRQRVEPVDLGHQQHCEQHRVRPFAAPADAPGQVAGAPDQRQQRQRPQQQLMAVEEPPGSGLGTAVHREWIGIPALPIKSASRPASLESAPDRVPRRGAGVVERGSLENCWRRKALVGSNPTPSAVRAALLLGPRTM